MTAQEQYLVRGKRLGANEWVEGYYVHLGPTDCQRAYIIPECASALHVQEVDPASLRRFSGQTDKEGARIWEGSVLRGPEGEIGVVRFGEYKDDNALEDDHFVGWHIEFVVGQSRKSVRVSILNGQSEGRLSIKRCVVVGDNEDMADTSP